MEAGLGFASYVHADNNQFDGLLLRFAANLQEEVRALSGDPNFRIFTDKADLGWGADWQEAIDAALNNVSMFIPFYSPRYFNSEACRDELRVFANGAKSLGKVELVLGLIYIPVGELLEPDTDDELKRLASQFQVVDIAAMRFMDHESAEYRRLVNEVATRLIDAADRATGSTPGSPVGLNGAGQPDGGDHGLGKGEGVSDVETSSDLDDDPGVIEVLADFEESLPSITASITGVAELLKLVGDIGTTYNEKLLLSDRQGKGFKGRLAVSAALANELRQVVDPLDTLASEFATDVIRADAGIRVMLRILEDDQEQLSKSEEFLNSITEMADQTAEGFGQIDGLSEILATLTTFSRELRGPVNELRQSLLRVTDAQQVFEDWGVTARRLLALRSEADGQ